MFNLLTTALTVIPPESLQYERFKSFSTNEIGLDVLTFEDPVEIKGSIQHHVSEKLYDAYGLSLNKDYCLVDVPAQLYGSEKQITPDKLTFHGETWIVMKATDWFIYNGWVRVIVVAEKDYEYGAQE